MDSTNQNSKLQYGFKSKLASTIISTINSMLLRNHLRENISQLKTNSQPSTRHQTIPHFSSEPETTSNRIVYDSWIHQLKHNANPVSIRKALMHKSHRRRCYMLLHHQRQTENHASDSFQDRAGIRRPREQGGETKEEFHTWSRGWRSCWWPRAAPAATTGRTPRGWPALLPRGPSPRARARRPCSWRPPCWTP